MLLISTMANVRNVCYCESKLTLRLEKLPMKDLARRLLVLGLDSCSVSVVSSPFP